MATKTFSSRVDEDRLRLANAVSQRDAGMSFGQFCGTSVMDYICAHNALPPMQAAKPHRSEFDVLRQLAQRHGAPDSAGATPVGDPTIGRLSDSEIKELIAKRYV